MKTILFFFTLVIISSSCQVTDAQNLSSFYNVSGESYTLSTTDGATKTMKLEATSDEDVTLRISSAVRSEFAQGTVFTISLGNGETVDFVAPDGDAHLEYIQVNGEQIEESQGEFLSPDEVAAAKDEKSYETNYSCFILKISKENVITPCYSYDYETNEGKYYDSKPFSIDSRDITLKIETPGAASITVALDKE